MLPKNKFTLSALLLLASAATTLAVKPQAWSHSTESDYTDGKFHNTVVDSYGTLTLGRALSPLPLAEKSDIVTAFTQTADGALVLATADKLLRIDNAKTSPLFTAPESTPDITALAPYKDSHILVALSGDSAKLMKVPTKTREAPSTLWEDKNKDKPVETIWAILPTPDGSFYLATGPHGTIYKLSTEGKSEKILETKSDNILSLTFDKSGNLIAGTDASHESGLVIRIDKNTNKPFVLLDTGENDVSALLTDPAGNIYVATASTDITSAHNNFSDPFDKKDEDPKSKSKPSTTEPDEAPDPVDESPTTKKKASHIINLRDRSLLAAGPDESLQKMLENLRAASGKPNALQTKPKPPQTKPSKKPVKKPGKSKPDFSDSSDEPASAVYQIAPDGLVTTIVSEPDANYALLLAKDELLIGTGMSGKLFAYRPADESLALIARVPHEQISALFAAKDQTLYVGTANQGAAFTLSPSLAATGTYTSDVLDAKHAARFGRSALTTNLPANTKATIAFRSGNTKDPAANEKFWSAWSDEISTPAAIPSPAARFLQYRITLTSDGKNATPSVTSTKIVYQVDNLPPVLKNITIDHDTPGISDPDSPPDRIADNDEKSPLLKISWDASDPNDDTLSHRIFYRPLPAGKPAENTGENNWTLLAKDLTETDHEWDTRSLPDGTYQLKIISSDSPDNAPDSARSVARESAPLNVDHTPPAIAGLAVTLDGNRAQITGTAKDNSAITDVRLQIVGQKDWQPLSSSDKIFDSPQEAFTGTTRPLAVGTHRIAIRATDEYGNSAYASTTVTVTDKK